jgi:hypothetical protein
MKPSLEWSARYADAKARFESAATDDERFATLVTLAKGAFELGTLDEAETRAHEALALASTLRNNWNYGNAIHDGHSVLGRVALAKGDVSAAKDHLLKAGRTPGSPQLNSFGPNVSLARDLLLTGKCRLWWNTSAFVRRFGRWRTASSLIGFSWQRPVRRRTSARTWCTSSCSSVCTTPRSAARAATEVPGPRQLHLVVVRPLFRQGRSHPSVAQPDESPVCSSATPEACDEVRICAAGEVQAWTIAPDVQEAIRCNASPTEVRTHYLVECQARPGRE